MCTHAHDDHVDAAAALAEATRAPIWLHPADRELWDQTYPDRAPDRDLADGQTITVAGADLTVLHTPGHSRGAVCFHLPDQRWLFSGDTLFAGGPGATGRSFSDFGTIIDSIRDRLLVLDPGTVVHTGHGPDTTIGAERPHLQEWIARGPLIHERPGRPPAERTSCAGGPSVTSQVHHASLARLVYQANAVRRGGKGEDRAVEFGLVLNESLS